MIKSSEIVLFFSVGGSALLLIFENLGLLEIKWKLIFKINGKMLSLECHVLTYIIFRSLFSWDFF